MSASVISCPQVRNVKARPVAAVAAPEEVEEVLPRADEPEALTEALKTCSDVCAGLIRKAVAFHNKDVADTLEKKWHLGEVVEDLREGDYTKPKNGNKPVNPVAVLSLAIGCSPSYLNKSAQLYRAYPTPDKLAWLTSRRTKQGKPLTYGHLEQLLRLRSDTDSNAQYDKVLKTTLEEDLTPEQIDNVIKSDKRQKGESTRKGGRPIAVPATVQQQFSRLLDQTEVIIKNDGELYSNEQHSFMARVKSMPQSVVAKDGKNLHDLLSKSRGNMTKLIAVFSTMIGSMAEIDEYVSKCENAMAHQDGKAAADAIEALASK